MAAACAARGAMMGAREYNGAALILACPHTNYKKPSDERSVCVQRVQVCRLLHVRPPPARRFICSGASIQPCIGTYIDEFCTESHCQAYGVPIRQSSPRMPSLIGRPRDPLPRTLRPQYTLYLPCNTTILITRWLPAPGPSWAPRSRRPNAASTREGRPHPIRGYQHAQWSTTPRPK